MYTYSFEKLDVWNEAKDFTKSLYTLTSKFPDSEKFGLVSQLRRASVSICSNIAEGSARNSYKDKAHFTTMAFGSTVEVLNQLILSYELNFISENDYLKLRQNIESVTNKLNGLRNFQISKSAEQNSVK
ncbi:four helix bundle protein [Flavobacterium maritimum]|uniref:four helix bundle protein n=1 Tax=Flavobacterium maritimum TaxID=3149042 RepID=UPI0032B533B4